MSTESIPVVREMELGIEGDRVVIEMVCTSDLAALVLYEDLSDRLSSGKPVKIVFTCGEVVEETGAGK